MKSNAPWSVKGIERDARETAKEAAKREGMTVGEWLNQVIYSAGGMEESTGEIEGLKLRDLVTAIEHLQKRAADAEGRSNAAIEELARKFGGMVERLQRVERTKPAEGSYEDLAVRLGKLEDSSSDRQRIEALKALEKAVAQVAVQFSNSQKTTLERLDAAEQQMQQLAARIENAGGDGAADLGFMKDAIDGLSARIARAERIAGEASKLKDEAAASIDPAFVEQTGNRLRILGDEIKRGGDQIRLLEAAIVKLSEQIEAAEKRSSEGVQKVSETIADLREQVAAETGEEIKSADIVEALADARRDTDERIAALQSAYDRMLERLENLGAETPSAPASQAPGPAAAEEFGASEHDTVAPLSFEIDEAGEEPQAKEEKDPFAFADEIETSPGEETDDGSDDFSFEFEEDESGKPSAGAGKEDESEDELDSILADLDDIVADRPFSKQKPKAPEKSKAERADVKALLSGAPPKVTKAPANAEQEEPDVKPKEKDSGDFLKAARERAKQHAEEMANKPTRRNLTPKQRAILAARAKQKQKAAEEKKKPDEEKSAVAKAPPKAPEPKPAPKDLVDADDDEEEEIGFFAKAKGAVSNVPKALISLKAKVLRKKDEEEEEDTGEEKAKEGKAEAKKPAPKKRPEGNDERAAFATLKSAALARPVTLALAVAIILALTALFFLIKDVIFTPEEPQPRPAVISTQPSPDTEVETEAGTEAETPGQTAEALPAVPEAPAVNPRDLYLESMSALNAAETDEAAVIAIEKLEQAAALGHPPAQLQLGELYKTGQGVDQDLGQARTWFRRAAVGGNVLAMHRIGVMTARGDGGQADSLEAIAWFERAANHGLVDSQYNLGAIYHPSGDGNSTVQDAGKAYYWYTLAAKNGDEQAQSLASSVSAGFSPEQRAQLDASIADWTPEPTDPEANELAPTE
jgi:localization factor PodJL